jgi:hypothetical protein
LASSRFAGPDNLDDVVVQFFDGDILRSDGGDVEIGVRESNFRVYYLQPPPLEHDSGPLVPVVLVVEEVHIRL